MNINPLADALINQEKTQTQQDINKKFPTSSARDIAQALDDGGDAAATRYGRSTTTVETTKRIKR